MEENRLDKDRLVFDENKEIMDDDVLPIHPPIKVIRYRTIKKNRSFGWWSAVVLVEDHEKKQVCFYRWRRKGNEWRRDKKLPIHSHSEWEAIKGAVETFLVDVE